MHRAVLLSILALSILVAAAYGQSAAHPAPPQTPQGPWQMQNSVTTANLRGIHAVGGGVAWASGTGGTVLRTEDSGYMWQTCSMPPGAEKLDFRAIWAWDADTAMVMSAGPGDQSRVYKTTDGCSSWKLLYTNPDKDGFFDGMVFLDRNQGVMVGDPVRGTIVLLRTSDGGKTWTREGGDQLKAQDGEGLFAASNSSLIWGKDVGGGTVVRFGTGGKTAARVFSSFSSHRSSSFSRQPVPLASGSESSGVFSIAFRDSEHGIAAGGDYKKPDEPTGTAAWTADGGKTWTAAIKPPHGYRSAVAWDEEQKVWIAVGTNGTDASRDDGKTWQPLDSGNWNALSLPWVVGPGGRIAKLVSLRNK